MPVLSIDWPSNFVLSGLQKGGEVMMICMQPKPRSWQLLKMRNDICHAESHNSTPVSGIPEFFESALCSRTLCFPGSDHSNFALKLVKQNSTLPPQPQRSQPCNFIFFNETDFLTDNKFDEATKQHLSNKNESLLDTQHIISTHSSRTSLFFSQVISVSSYFQSENFSRQS